MNKKQSNYEKGISNIGISNDFRPVSYTHLRAHETDSYLVCRLLLEKKKTNETDSYLVSHKNANKQYQDEVLQEKLQI